MNLFDTASSAQSAKRSERLSKISDQQKRDRKKYPFATYAGKDPDDGTDLVQINGEIVSGKLVSNASLSVGSPVSLRPNQQGGLQRIDAKNVAPEKVPEELVLEDVAAQLTLVAFWISSTYGYSSLPSVYAQLDITSSHHNNPNKIPENAIIEYLYDSRIKYKKKSKIADIPKEALRISEDATNPAYTVGMDRNLCSFKTSFNTVDGKDLNVVTINLNQSLPVYPDPWLVPVNSGGRLASPVYWALIEIIIFFPFKGFKRKLKDLPLGRFASIDSPIEFEILVNNAVPDYAAEISLAFVDENTNGFYGESGWSIYYFNTPTISPLQTKYTMSFRWRKRGNEQWFSL